MSVKFGMRMHDDVGLGLPLPCQILWKSVKGIYPFGENLPKNYNFGDFSACKPTFLKPKPWTSAWGYAPGTLSPAPNFVKVSLEGICPLGANVYQKLEIFAILSYLSPHLCAHSVEILLNGKELRIHERHKISSESLKGPVGIALPRRWCILISSFW